MLRRARRSTCCAAFIAANGHSIRIVDCACSRSTEMAAVPMCAMKGPFMGTRLTATAADWTAGLWTDVMVRSLFAVSFVLAPAIQPQVTAQAGPPLPSETPTFEVALIRPNNSGENGMRFNYFVGGRFTATNVTLRMLIRSAYGMQDSQLVGGPKWTSVDRFNIVAKGDAGQSPPPMVIQPGGPSRLQLMMQALLADR